MKNLLIVFICIFFLGCSKGELTTKSDKSYIVVIGVYKLNGNNYIDQNKDLIFTTQETCQSWSRTAQGDFHQSTIHLHYNAAKNTLYDNISETITWVEYGPELNQSSIEETCNKGNNGVSKSANKTQYTPIQNFYLKIKTATEN